MTTIAGIDLDKNEARFVVLTGHALNFDIVPTAIVRLGLGDPKDQQEVRDFLASVQAFFDEHSVDAVAIRERLSKGRMKGGTITFKLEGLIQTCRQPVTLISPATIRKSITAANIDFAELPIAKFQHEAYGAAYTLITTSE
ncbi:MAG: DUF3010 family protein [Pyrinomonadaceae bacterium]|nr:DUF3010 family protein [Pyrinomonadaceae bacterium]MBP6211896.1 DUF3010 family protein [Pyrinomonadaceae bacterium]